MPFEWAIDIYPRWVRPAVAAPNAECVFVSFDPAEKGDREELR